MSSPRRLNELVSTVDKVEMQVLQARNNDGFGGTYVWGNVCVGERIAAKYMLKSRGEVWRSLQHVRSTALL